MTSQGTPTKAEAKPTASTRHFLVFLGIVVTVTFAGFAAQHRPVAGGGMVETHEHVIPIYLSLMILNWLLVFFVWRGIRRQGNTFHSLIQGRWASIHDVYRDLILAAAFWGLLLGVAWGLDHLLSQGQAKSLELLLPRSTVEVGVWILTSISAGFCEEFVFRGYVQRQLFSWSGSTSISVLGQSFLFGMMHAYQGWMPALRIVVLGVLFGALAAWRRTLRVGMIAHAWQDIWAGWLANVILRP
jgi:membrane protease YdiL (CAAX protease family)